MKKLIAFTGGHHNSTLEVANLAKEYGYQTLWFGQKFSLGQGKSLSSEYIEVNRSGIRFLDLKTGRFYKKINLIEWLKVGVGFFQSIYYLSRYRPNLIFSSGGYLSVPVVIAGWVLGIPSFTHEQTVVAGWANKAIAPFVKKILLTHESSLANYPGEKSVIVGLPIKPGILNKGHLKKFSPPLLYITCGKQGSHLINKTLFPIIPELVNHFTVVHQIGSNVLNKDLDRARRIKEKLGEVGRRYTFSPYFFSEDSSTYLRSASVVVSRAGAHTVYELMVLAKKAVLIPISWVSHNEQLLNAKLANNEMGSILIEEKNLNSSILLDSIIRISKAKQVKPKTKLPTDASKKILQIIDRSI